MLPLARVKSPLFGDALVSMPFCVYGGTLGESRTRAHRAEQRAGELAHEAVASTTWSAQPCAPQSRIGRRRISTSRSASRSIAESEKNMQAIPRKQRAMVRKGIKKNLTAVLDGGVDRFYDIYSESLRNLGTPVFSRRYFAAAAARCSGRTARVSTVMHERRARRERDDFLFPRRSAAVLRRRLAAARPLARQRLHVLGPDAPRGRARLRASSTSAAASADTGAFDFKKHWGFEPQPLHYEYFLVQRAQRARRQPDQSEVPACSSRRGSACRCR